MRSMLGAVLVSAAFAIAGCRGDREPLEGVDDGDAATLADAGVFDAAVADAGGAADAAVTDAPPVDAAVPIDAAPAADAATDAAIDAGLPPGTCAGEAATAWTGYAERRHEGATRAQSVRAEVTWQLESTVGCVDRYRPTGRAIVRHAEGCVRAAEPTAAPVAAADGLLIVDRSTVPPTYHLDGETRWTATVTCGATVEAGQLVGGPWASDVRGAVSGDTFGATLRAGQDRVLWHFARTDARFAPPQAACTRPPADRWAVTARSATGGVATTTFTRWFNNGCHDYHQVTATVTDGPPAPLYEHLFVDRSTDPPTYRLYCLFGCNYPEAQGGVFDGVRSRLRVVVGATLIDRDLQRLDAPAAPPVAPPPEPPPVCSGAPAPGWAGHTLVSDSTSSRGDSLRADVQWQLASSAGCVDRYRPTGTVSHELREDGNTFVLTPATVPVAPADGELIIDRRTSPPTYRIDGTTLWAVTRTNEDGTPRSPVVVGGAWARDLRGTVDGPVLHGNVGHWFARVRWSLRRTDVAAPSTPPCADPPVERWQTRVALGTGAIVEATWTRTLTQNCTDHYQATGTIAHVPVSNPTCPNLAFVPATLPLADGELRVDRTGGPPTMSMRFSEEGIATRTCTFPDGTVTSTPYEFERMAYTSVGTEVLGGRQRGSAMVDGNQIEWDLTPLP